ncbi:MAG TPA: OsmC family protein [Ornithinicoccus sp.]|jgi:organic hydroperoxide reductase OsmC/OhrA|nr:OsmC family protein [Ornithinicoccus sp.]
MTTHTYAARLTWSGSTGGGVRAYDRAHRVTAPPARTALTLSADPAFRGDPDLLNPEQLLVAAAASCQLLSFLGAAARAGVDVVGYEDRAEGYMDLTDTPARISRILLTPTITTPADPDEVTRLVQVAHEHCYIANSLSSHVQVQPKVVTP